MREIDGGSYNMVPLTSWSTNVNRLDCESSYRVAIGEDIESAQYYFPIAKPVGNAVGNQVKG